MQSKYLYFTEYSQRIFKSHYWTLINLMLRKSVIEEFHKYGFIK